MVDRGVSVSRFVSEVACRREADTVTFITRAGTAIERKGKPLDTD